MPQHKTTRAALAGCPHQRHELVSRCHHWFRAANESVSGQRRRYAGARALKDRHSDRALQLQDSPTERRLFDIERTRRSIEAAVIGGSDGVRSEEHTSELQSLMRISYAVFCLKKKTTIQNRKTNTHTSTQ